MPTFFAWILAPTTTAPVVSMAVPESTAVVTCACKLLTARALNKSTTSAQQTIFPWPKENLNLNMLPPLDFEKLAPCDLQADPEVDTEQKNLRLKPQLIQCWRVTGSHLPQGQLNCEVKAGQFHAWA